jgi:hypothetical protein
VTAPVDPYRTLGLPRGAALPDVKRAYRRLAKLHHPDSAGPTALPRFLAIQAAYDAITGLSAAGHAPQRPATARPTPPAWAADSERARAARSRARSARSSGPDRRGTTSDRSTSDRSSSDRSSSDRSGPARHAGSSRSRSDRAGGRATLGSTSYDGADEEPFEPDWAGGSWYGAGSGTYWRVNPKEYADPRKHGPEYQARGRARAPESRAAAGGAQAPRSAGAPAAESEAASGGASAPASDPEAGGRSWTEASNPAWSTRSTSAGSWTNWPGDRPPGRAADSGHRGAPTGHDVGQATFDAVGTAAGIPAWLDTPTARRVATLLLAWPPIGFLLAAVAGEMTGCGRYSASCSGGLDLLPWLVQPLVIGALLVFPAIAEVAAIGAIGALVAGVPVAIILSVTGGGRGPAAMTATALVIALIVGYAIGLAGAALGRFRLPGSSASSSPTVGETPAPAGQGAAGPRDDSG